MILILPIVDINPPKHIRKFFQKIPGGLSSLSAILLMTNYRLGTSFSLSPKGTHRGLVERKDLFFTSAELHVENYVTTSYLYDDHMDYARLRIYPANNLYSFFSEFYETHVEIYDAILGNINIQNFKHIHQNKLNLSKLFVEISVC